MTFLNSRFNELAPYVPGEQPQVRELIKLNTNESPFPPAPGVTAAIAKAATRLALYSDPTCQAVIAPLAKTLGVAEENVFLGNGSDEVLAFCFQGFTENGVIFPQTSYGFYPVFSQLYQLDAEEVPLKEDLSLDLAPYFASDKTVVIANPNAPTGLALSRPALTELVAADPERLVIIDEAYVDFGADSLIPLISQYDNLLIIGTFSKSRQLAGARLGFAVGSASLIKELNRLKFSFNPYNINSLTLAAGQAVLAEPDYFATCRNEVIATREFTQAELRKLGFETTDSQANFVFVKHPRLSGKALYQALREQKILVRWFDKEPIKEYLRITIGTKAQMQTLLTTLKVILEGQR